MGYLCPGGKVCEKMSLQTDQNNSLHLQIWFINIDGMYCMEGKAKLLLKTAFLLT